MTAIATHNNIAPALWAAQLEDNLDQVQWLWEGLLARGNVTLLTSQWKSGKTTLLSILLSRLKEGGALAERAIPAGRAAVVSEEPRLPWRLRQRRLQLGDVCFWLQPFRGKPALDDWTGLLDRILEQHASRPFDLAVIDTLTSFLPASEANAGSMMEALLPLRRLTEANLAVLLMHHPPKGESLPGQAARGSGALPSFADILVEMSFYTRGDPSDRRRRLLAFSRYEQTPPQLVLELNPEGTDYLVHGNFSEDEFTQNWQRLKLALEDANAKATRQELLQAWPPDYPAPSDATLYRWLTRAAGLGLCCQEGEGRRSDPFRYWLPELESKWKQDPLYELHRQLEAANAEALGKRVR